ncbi:MAG: hypothetical protein ABIP79_13480 [Chitinophagaceae bacterium]
MKKLILILSFSHCLLLNAQTDSSYQLLLKNISEVQLTDSLLLNAIELQSEPLDTFIIKKWFALALSTNNTNRLKNRNYYLTGKITHNNNFDLLVVVEEKMKADVTGMQIVYLVSTKKNGDYISSLEVAVAGIKNNSNYNTSSLLYKDNKLKLDTKFVANDSSYAEVNVYKITKTGRFLLAPKY